MLFIRPGDASICKLVIYLERNRNSPFHGDCVKCKYDYLRYNCESLLSLLHIYFFSNSAPDLRDLVDKGLIAVAKNDFPEAFLIFQKALHLDSGNTMILNNMGVCLLYAGKLKDAINYYERAINLNPQKSLNESLLVNLSTLYELESNNSKTKKLNLLRLINRFKPDLTYSVEICLKLQATN